MIYTSLFKGAFHVTRTFSERQVYTKGESFTIITEQKPLSLKIKIFTNKVMHIKFKII